MTSNRCQQCGLVNFAGTAACRRCKAPSVWGGEVDARLSASVPQPVFSADGGDSYQQQQPFHAAPSIPNYGATAGGYAASYEQMSTTCMAGYVPRDRFDMDCEVEVV